MLNQLPPDDVMYQALVDRDSRFEGLFIAAVKSTGIFCLPTCPARKPKPENVEFFPSTEAAQYAGYRACLRCHPLDAPGSPSDLVAKLLTLIENKPERRWTSDDLSALGIEPGTARRHFKRRFGVTFAQYARARRLGHGLKSIQSGSAVIEAQLDAGFESGSGFRQAFDKALGRPPRDGKDAVTLYSAWINTELGPMIAIADEQALLLLDFADRKNLSAEVDRMKERLNCAVLPGDVPPLFSIADDLKAYFAGQGLCFKTPLRTIGTDFQQSVWRALQDIPPGETRSYQDIAKAVGRPKAFRAVARANASNQLAIIVPCHRVVRGNGALSGYAGGQWRKRWLIEHERAAA